MEPPISVFSNPTIYNCHGISFACWVGARMIADITRPDDLRRVAAEFMRLMASAREPEAMRELSALASECFERAKAIEAARGQTVEDAAD